MADQQLVLGIFADEAAADVAVKWLKDWDNATEEIKLGAIGILVIDEFGKLKEHKLGARSGKKGAGIGLVLAVVAPPTLLAGIVGGGVLGHFHHTGLGLSTEDRERIVGELRGGKAAVGVLAKGGDVAAVSAQLTDLDGIVEVHEATEEAVEAVAAAVGDTPTTTA